MAVRLVKFCSLLDSAVTQKIISNEWMVVTTTRYYPALGLEGRRETQDLGWFVIVETRSVRPRKQHDCHHDKKVKPEAVTAFIELLMLGGKTPETC